MLDPRTRTQIMHGEVLKKKLLMLANKFVLCNKTREDGEEQRMVKINVQKKIEKYTYDAKFTGDI